MIRSLLVLAGAVAAGLLARAFLILVVRRTIARADAALRDSLIRRLSRPTGFTLVVLALYWAHPAAPLEPEWADRLDHLLRILLVVGVAWLLVGGAAVLEDAVEREYRLDVADNLRARRIQTKVRLLRRIVVVLIGVVAFSLILMTFPGIRQLGISLFASAGAAGLVLGIAARPALSNLIAGVQVALTEPIRLDDVVIVEGEWGRIEEIRTTYVVIRIWDLRRLMVPISYFIEQPFQNWTRTSAQIIGSVFLFTDYRVPVDEIRAELGRILEGTDLWDGEVSNVQVVDTTETTVKVRILVTAADSPRAWDLRCLVRERLVDFLKERYPESLPRTRVELEGQMGRPSEEGG